MAISQRLALSNTKRLTVALSCTALGLVALAGLVANELTTGNQRTALGQTYLDPAQNPFAGSGSGGFTPGDDSVPEYYGLNPDEPGRPGSFAWATSKNEDGDVVNGHGSDWIYSDGWKNPGKVLKGPNSYYYNELDLDENNQPQADVDNEQSNADHTTTMPYSYAASDGVTVGPEAVNMITSFDPYITDSNGVY
uniref:Uncharacterized protein n=1 Tax=Cryptomonas curvata TaxID=233186 RepID=A0A7S0MA33_9CRYP|mmetsp:Transcript_31740/g.66392  ORF Transcript_31740/g.66392 Transcript_31740/m.66392 type:complete len:194 (+) Transcript_31740:30-611(+)